MRLLRTYRHFAQQPHFCDRCHSHIEPGEEYEGWVYADHQNMPPAPRLASDNKEPVASSHTRKSIIVIKEHARYCNDPFEDEMREEMERGNRERNKNRNSVAA